MTTFLIILAVFFALLAVAVLVIKYFVIKTFIKIAVTETKQKIKDHPLAKDLDPEFFEEEISVKQIRNKLISATKQKVIEKVKDEINKNKDSK